MTISKLDDLSRLDGPMTAVRVIEIGRQPEIAKSSYTLHIDFTAESEPHAALLAIRFAEGLGRLRNEVDTCSARLSTTADQGDTQPLFCGATGPGGERCADEPGHGGYHAEGCIDGYVWSDNDRGQRRSR